MLFGEQAIEQRGNGRGRFHRVDAPKSTRRRAGRGTGATCRCRPSLEESGNSVARPTFLPVARASSNSAATSSSRNKDRLQLEIARIAFYRRDETRFHVDG